FNERESLGFLRFGVTNYLDRVSDQVVGGKPRLDIVGRHPDREISEEYRETHSLQLSTPYWGRFFEAMPRRRFSNEAINNDSTTTKQWQTSFLSEITEKLSVSPAIFSRAIPGLPRHGEMPIRPTTKSNHASLSTILSGHSSCQEN